MQDGRFRWTELLLRERLELKMTDTVSKTRPEWPHDSTSLPELSRRALGKIARKIFRNGPVVRSAILLVQTTVLYTYTRLEKMYSATYVNLPTSAQANPAWEDERAESDRELHPT